jgi:hypothetical protein
MKQKLAAAHTNDIRGRGSAKKFELIFNIISILLYFQY